jgi:hypothetical protein
MRRFLTLLLTTAWAAVALAQAQTAAPAADAAGRIDRSPASAATVKPSAEPKSAHPARSAAAPARARAAPAPARDPAAKGDGVLTLGATDITGNKELPKVMVIVPWKDATGAGGVIKPTDSLMNEVLGPVDRGVFQRRIRYYGQLGTAEQGAGPAAAVAPVGDKH